MPQNPKVSVDMVTYNHAQFISKALDSVLMQETSFDFEIVIGDDCSTDGTTEILRNYQHRWPERVKPILRERNIGASKNVTETLSKCCGEYVAWLEGDDFWTDPQKLQLQVNYLDKHRDCALVHHQVDYLSWPSGRIVGQFPPEHYRLERPPRNSLAAGNFIQACSVMFRRAWLPPLDDKFLTLKLGDWPMCVLLSQRGWIGYIDRMMAHYRLHTTSNWSTRPGDYRLRAVEDMAWYLLERVDTNAQDAWKNTLLAIALKQVALAMRQFAPHQFFKRLCQLIRLSAQFRKPFWPLVGSLPFYRANRLATCPMRPNSA